MKDETTVSFPVRMPKSLGQQVKEMCEQTGLSQQDVMRLALRVGLNDMKNVGADLAKLIAEASEDVGVSFETWALEKVRGKNQKGTIVHLEEHLSSKAAEGGTKYGEK